MNVEQVRAALERNKKPLAIAGAVAAGGLGLLKARSGGTGAAAAPAARTGPSVKPSGVAVSGYAPGTYDSSTSDLYNALQQQLTRTNEFFEQAKSPIPVPAAPPIASTIFAPRKTGNYWQQGKRDDGGKSAVFEVQDDGSLYHLSESEWTSIVREQGKGDANKVAGLNRLTGDYVPGAFYRGIDNAAAKSTGAPVTRFGTRDNGAHYVYKG